MQLRSSSESELSNRYTAKLALVTDGTAFAVLKPVANVLTEPAPNARKRSGQIMVNPRRS
jgi:hypothetical protein